ncbi:MAG: thiol reductant ABC exporter subunit CydD [Anaerolineales bacterium]
MRIERRLLASIRPASRDLGLTILLGLISALITILQAYLLSRVVARIFLERQDATAVLPLLLGWLALALLKMPLHVAQHDRAQSGANQIKRRLRTHLTSAIVHLGPQWLNEQRSGYLLISLTEGMEALDAYLGGYLPQLVLAAAIPFAMLVTLAPIDLVTALVLLVTGPLIPLFMILIGDRAERMTVQRWRSLGWLSAILLDSLQGLTTLKLLGQLRAQSERIARAGDRFRHSTMEVLRVTFLSALILEWVAMLGTAIVAVEIGLRLLYGRLDFEAAFFILLLAPEFYAPLRALGARFHAGMAGFEAATRMYDIIEISSPERPVRAHTAGIIPREIAFERVSFSYPGRSLDAVDELDFRLRAGEQIAVLGPSGCGKTTLTKLLLRFIDPDSGQILVDGKPLASIPLRSWRKQIAWVPQNPHLFACSALENIRLARPEASFEQVVRAARSVGLHQELLALPAGYDTPLGERGLRLSAGQVQRVALARACLKDAPLLVLDEATANLDPLTEASLLGMLRELLADRTAVIITHRLGTARLAENVIIMESGRVVQAGTHASLLETDGPYARLAVASGRKR